MSNSLYSVFDGLSFIHIIYIVKKKYKFQVKIFSHIQYHDIDNFLSDLQFMFTSYMDIYTINRLTVTYMLTE